eukprot:scaffold4970_cov16-Prasinocladus_malaysianus.AAC.2
MGRHRRESVIHTLECREGHNTKHLDSALYTDDENCKSSVFQAPGRMIGSNESSQCSFNY